MESNTLVALIAGVVGFVAAYVPKLIAAFRSKHLREGVDELPALGSEIGTDPPEGEVGPGASLVRPRLHPSDLEPFDRLLATPVSGIAPPRRPRVLVAEPPAILDP